MRPPYVTIAGVCVLLGSAASAHEAPSGLYVRDGVLLMHGRPYRGIGVNYFDAFYRTVKDPQDTSYRDGFRVLRTKYGIPFIRFCAAGFWPADWKLYQTDRRKYFELFDAFVEAAEQERLGLIPSLFWRLSAVPDLVGEPMDQLGDPASKTHGFLRTYVGDVVRRYKSSSAVWGWEIGNEYNLAMDLPNASKHRPKVVPQLGTPTTRSARDEPTAGQLVTALRVCAKEIRLLDPHHIITSGNSIPRWSAWHNTHEKSWTRDTEAQFGEVLRRDNPVGVDVISVHIYPQRKSGYFADREVGIAGLIEATLKACAVANKPLLVGEFGAPRSLGADEERVEFSRILDAIVKHRVPLAAVWVFDRRHPDNAWNITADNDRAYMLEAIRKANQGIRP